MTTPKTEKVDKPRTATRQIEDALVDKGYRQLARLGVDRKDYDRMAFTIYARGKNVLLLQEYDDGGCELYRPLVDSIRVEDTIEAIP